MGMLAVQVINSSYFILTSWYLNFQIYRLQPPKQIFCLYLLYLMSKQPKNKKQQYVQMASADRSREESSRSNQELNTRNLQTNQRAPLVEQKQGFISRNGKTIGYGAGGVGLILAIIIFRQSFQPGLLLSSQYQFMVYCPIKSPMIEVQNSYAYTPGLFQLQAQSDEVRFLTNQYFKRNLDEQNDKVDKYIIYVKQYNISQQVNSTVFMYCSWVTDWVSRDCANAQPVCSFPGPIFYIKRNQPIDVAWVYNLENVPGHNFNVNSSSVYNTSFDLDLGCYGKSGDHCKLRQKKKSGCTYLDPTNQSLSDLAPEHFVITKTSVPISVHIHGLEVRPVFDGNPISWFGPIPLSKDRPYQLGSGYQSLFLNKKYFETFRNTTTTSLQPQANTLGNFYFKINRYENFQPPGNLWYHDHSMHITMVNVKLGMAGDYIIYDPQVEEQMPYKQHQIFIVAGQNFRNQSGDIKVKNSQEIGVYQQGHGGIKVNPKNVPFATQDSLTLERNQTYRIRILNAQFDAVFTNLRFLTECDEKQTPVNSSTCKKRLQFTVIGSDSSLFKTTVTNVSAITIASAERFQILIVFDGVDGKGATENVISKDASYVYLVNDEGPDSGREFIRLRYQLLKQPSVNNQKVLPSQFTQINGLTFYNLTNINRKCGPADTVKTQCLSVLRMRPYFFDGTEFYFNGHYDFGGSGASDNPQIGTTEDWFFINTIFFGHPIHVHLINFQVIAKGTLAAVFYNNFSEVSPVGKKTYNLCSFYEMDYYLEVGAIPESFTTSYAQVCNYTRNQLSIANLNLTNQFRQDQIGQNSVSGFDAFTKISNQETHQYSLNATETTNCPNGLSNTYKYLCSQLTDADIPQWYKRWKEVVYMPQFTIFQVRIRWTKTEYKTGPQYKQFGLPDPYPYFSVPEDQLLEHPGFVYHCHFLQHQDNELMRSIMMQPSDQFAQNYPTDQLPIGPCMKAKGKDNKQGWKARYECINEYTGCN